jgi:hypothetical protein
MAGVDMLLLEPTELVFDAVRFHKVIHRTKQRYHGHDASSVGTAALRPC